ncbi:ester cyclase [Shinella sp.]|uniref:ester cyclase n=1 Tax=Shinella sp. TaxID=1870904 RepID=UPI003F6E98B7
MMNEQSGKVVGKQALTNEEAPAAKGRTEAKQGRSRFRPLSPEHMPRDYAISLDAYRRGGTDAFIGRSPDHLVKQRLTGFEPQYVNIIDYIIRITHQIWEEKDIGYIYDTYSHDCLVWDDLALQVGRDKIVADTTSLNNAFPDIRIVAEDVVWAGDDAIGFHTSHRSQIIGTNTGFSRYGAPTGRRVQFLCMANCVARDNEIFYEHVVYDTAEVVKQLGFDVVETAKRAASSGVTAGLPRDFLGGEPKRTVGQGKPEKVAVPTEIRDNPEEFVRAALHTMWNRRNLGALDQVYHPGIVSQQTGSRIFRGTGQLRSFMLSQLAMFPDVLYSVDDLYWMGNAQEGFVVATRWSMTGTHRGLGRYGEPTGREVNIWGITHWLIEGNRVTKEWTTFNEFGVLIQVLR